MEQMFGEMLSPHVPAVAASHQTAGQALPFFQMGPSISTIGILWKPSLHDYESISALEFSSPEDVDAFIDKLWSNEPLRTMPRAHVGRNTIIVPTQAVPLLLHDQFTFRISRVTSSR